MHEEELWENIPDDRTQNLNEVADLVRELERRIRELEHERRAEPMPINTQLWPQPVVVASGPVEALPPIPVGVITVLGKALLGIAGAYLLRAAAESGAVPQWAAVLAGLIYAGWWLISSSRVASGNRFTIAAYGITAALVLSPMLWETTVRFQVLPPPITAALLVLFVVLGAALASTGNLPAITWITTLAGIATALALISATRAVVPFTAALLLIAVIIEYAACRDRWLSERWIVALTADLSVFLLTYLVTRPTGLPEGYAPVPTALVIAIQIALLSIYLSSTVYRTLIHGLSITSFEVAQAIIAFLISIGGILEVTRQAIAASVSVAMFSIVIGVACYLVGLGFLAQKSGRQRNLHAYACFGPALLLTACYILTSGVALAAAWAVLAIAAMWTGERLNRTTLRMHAALYLFAASIASGLIGFGYDRIIGSAAPWPAPDTGVIVVVFAAACCYALNRNTVGFATRIPAVIISAVLCWSFLGLAVGAVAPAEPGVLAALRTASLCVLAIVLAWAGLRWKRQELTWLLYLSILPSVILLIDDFRQCRAVTMCLSLLFYGGALMLVPRLVRGGTKLLYTEPASAQVEPVSEPAGRGAAAGS